MKQSVNVSQAGPYDVYDRFINETDLLLCRTLSLEIRIYALSCKAIAALQSYRCMLAILIDCLTLRFGIMTK